VIGGGEYLQRRRLVVDDDWFFISGQVVVKIVEDNRPIRRRFLSSLKRIVALFPQSTVVKDSLAG
jgi:hypothetical protein